MVEQMKEIIGLSEIQYLISHLSKANSQITLWQKLDDYHKRVSHKAILVKFHELQSELEFIPKRGDFKFSSKYPLYLVSAHRLILLKAQIAYNSNSKLIIKIPNYLLIKESRTEVREEFRNKDVYIEYTHTPEKDLFLEHQFHRAKLLDLSSSGLAFRSSKNNIVRFQKGDKLFIRTENEQGGKFVQAHVHYIDRQWEKLGISEFYRIGLRYH